LIGKLYEKLFATAKAQNGFPKSLRDGSPVDLRTFLKSYTKKSKFSPFLTQALISLNVTDADYKTLVALKKTRNHHSDSDTDLLEKVQLSSIPDLEGAKSIILAHSSLFEEDEETE